MWGSVWRGETSHSPKIFLSLSASSPLLHCSLSVRFFLCASSSFLPKIGIEYPHKTHTCACAPVHTQTHGVPQTVLRLQQILANHMKRASSSCGLFIKKRKSKRGKPLSMQLQSHRLHIITVSLTHKRNLCGTSRSYHEHEKSKFLHTVSYCRKNFASDVVRQLTNDDVKFAFIFFTVCGAPISWRRPD